MPFTGIPLFFLAFCFGATLADVGRIFCRNQVARWDPSVQAIDNAMRQHSDLDALCRTMVSFTQEAVDTNSTCPGRLESEHPAYASFWAHTENNIAEVCYGYNSARVCSARVPRKMMRRCVKAIPAHVTASQEILCTASEAFVDCIKEIAILCRGSPALVTKDVVFSLSSMEVAMVRMCQNVSHGAAPEDSASTAALLDRMQGDAPASSGAQCTDDTVANPHIMVCERTKFDTSNRNTCRSKQLRLACMRRVTEGTCTSLLDQSIIDATQSDYAETCRNSVGPRDVADERSSVLPDELPLDILNEFRD